MTAFAPYAQAAATVRKDGTIVRSKNVTNVTRDATGKYFITVDSSISAAKSVPQGSIDRPASWGSEIYVGLPSSPPDDHTFQVWTGVNAEASDQPFHFIVP